MDELRLTQLLAAPQPHLAAQRCGSLMISPQLRSLLALLKYTAVRGSSTLRSPSKMMPASSPLSFDSAMQPDSALAPPTAFGEPRE
eukprot:scaffold14992_cov69-Phaeocystis_antarctica.AAC.8